MKPILTCFELTTLVDFLLQPLKSRAAHRLTAMVNFWILIGVWNEGCNNTTIRDAYGSKIFKIFWVCLKNCSRIPATALLARALLLKNRSHSFQQERISSASIGLSGRAGPDLQGLFQLAESRSTRRRRDRVPRPHIW